MISQRWVGAAAIMVACGLTACAREQSPEELKCEGLEHLALEHATITSARASSAGYDFSLPAAFMARTPFLKVPAACRVELLLKPSGDSSIKTEVWLPLHNWNGKLQGLGNGGFAGSIDRLQLILSVQQGYAAAATDTGHEGDGKDGTWAWNQQALLATPGAYIPPEKFDAIAAAVVKACDSLDGVSDGVLDDPRDCRFSPESMSCKVDDADDCLTAPQVQALNKIYAGPGGALDDSRHRGFEPGAELGTGSWKEWISGSKREDSLEYLYALQFYRYLVYDNPDWNLDRFEFARDRPAMRARLGDILDARNPDLSRFKARGGKLILYHGWSDSALQPRLAIDYYDAVRARMGDDKAAEFVRLYMVPGMQHCVGGPGPNNFGQMPPAGNGNPARNVNAALEAWVEQGVLPDAIVAAKYDYDWKAILAPEKTRLLRTRPLCPYPQVARWKGQGSTDVAENFSCIAAPR